ncbi:hypothetical protein H9P43_005728 [Blastocladiella emersonii ATCC 22665]|nr:hypothetical protein H9P43_005728 [Blastocladiella emersonii ATCC 22665]
MGKSKDAAGESAAAAAPVAVEKTAKVADPKVAEQYKKPPGPVTSRKCRDVLFMVLFILFWFGMAVIAGIAFQKGDLNRLKYGTDSLGNTCGVYNPAVGNISAFDATNKTYLHYLNLGFSDNPVKVCVNACPAQGEFVCQYNVTLASDNQARAQQVQNGTCFPVAFPLQSLVWRCIPLNLMATAYNATVSQNTTLSKVANVVATDLNAQETATKISQALIDSWEVILGMAFASVGISFIWLFLLNWFSGVMVWITVVVANASLGGLTAFLWYNWHMIKTQGKLIMTGNPTIDLQVYNEQTLLVLGIISAVVFGVVFFISVAARQRIKLAIVIIKETSRAIRAMPMIVFFPVFKYAIMAALFAYFVIVFALLASSGTAIAQEATTQITTQLQGTTAVRQVTPERVLQFLQIYHVFGFFWAWSFILGVWQTTIAGSVATWYWCRDKSNLPRFAVAKSLWRCFRYHLGSIALGAMIIAIVQLIRVFLFEAQRRLKGSNNKAAQYTLACLQCCFACLEKFLKFINKNAYILIAVEGYGFCEAASTAFQLLFRNAFRVAVIDRVANFLLFLGKLLIVAVTCLISLGILWSNYAQLGSYYAVPLIFIFVISWIVASFFTSVVDMGIDTLFLCFCEDCERHDGSAQNPYYMSNELKAFTDKHKGTVPDIAS